MRNVICWNELTRTIHLDKFWSKMKIKMDFQHTYGDRNYKARFFVWFNNMAAFCLSFFHVRPFHPIRLRFVRPRPSCKDVQRICSDMSFLGNSLTRQLSCFTFSLAALHVCAHFLKRSVFFFPHWVWLCSYFFFSVLFVIAFDYLFNNSWTWA